MPIGDYAIPAAFNTLDDQPFDDGHPLSSWAAREVLHNDRLLHATLDACHHAKAWDLTHPYIHKGAYWTRLVTHAGFITPGRRSLTVRFRGTISNGIPALFVVITTAHQGRERSEGFNGWTEVVGTGVVANWEITGIPIEGGRPDFIEVLCKSGVITGTGADVTGALTSIRGSSWNSAAAFVGVDRGWLIRAEDAASGTPLTRWFTIVNKVSDSALTTRPGTDGWFDIASDLYESGAVNFRARESASITMRSVTIDEDALTGELEA